MGSDKNLIPFHKKLIEAGGPQVEEIQVLDIKFNRDIAFDTKMTISYPAARRYSIKSLRVPTASLYRLMISSYSAISRSTSKGQSLSLTRDK